jgi:hypothetical protein
MNRINVIRNSFIAWGKTRNIANSTRLQAISGTLNAFAFAAVLVVCSIAVGCSSDKPKPISSNTQVSMNSQPSVEPAPAPAPAAQPAPKPVQKKAAPKKPATVNYTDKTYGVAFEYPRRYAIETGDAASELILTNPVPMNFVAPGGVALAAVELPETGFANTDFSSAFFNVSVHKTLSADQCSEFSVPQPKVAEIKTDSSNEEAQKVVEEKPAVEKTVAQTNIAPQTEAASSTPDVTRALPPTQATESATPADSASAAKAEATPDQSTPKSVETASKPIDLKVLELNATEAVSGEGTRQSDSRYFHVYQNGSCYEFALNVTTNANGDGMTKHIDRDKVFARLEKILATVKLEAPAAPAPEVKAAEVKTDAPAAPPTTETPAQ